MSRNHNSGEPKGKRLEITNEKESWGEAILSDGTKIRFKTIIVCAIKTKDGYYFKPAFIGDTQ